MKIFTAILLLSLVGCTSAPPDSLEGLKQAQRWEVYKQCRQEFRDSRSAGIITAGVDEFHGCMTYAKLMVR